MECFISRSQVSFFVLLSEKSLILSANHYGFNSHTIISSLRTTLNVDRKSKENPLQNDKHKKNGNMLGNKYL